METSKNGPGTSPMAPAQMQRAVFIAVLSFFFFLATMCGYYIRPSPLYFLLATAFLIIYLITMVSFVRLLRKAGITGSVKR